MTRDEGEQTKRQRVLLLTMDFPPDRGGIQTMARELLARAHRTEFRVIAPSHPRAADSAFGVPVRRVPAIAPGAKTAAVLIALAARAEIRRFRPDAVLALHVLAAPGALTTRIPVVLVCHGGELRSPRIARIARWAFPRAERVIANSRFTRSVAVALGADPMKTGVISVGAPDPVDVPAHEVEALRRRLGGGRIVLSVSRLEPHKGHDRLIHALATLPEDVRLVLIGRGSAEAELREAARAAGLAERVVFAGSVDDDELPCYYVVADAFALLSRATTGERAGVEGGGIAVLEACAYGLPVVVAATGGLPETIRQEETGLLVDPDDPTAVAHALHRVLEDRALASRLGEAARAMATGERSWAGFVDAMELVLETAAKRGTEVAR